MKKEFIDFYILIRRKKLAKLILIETMVISLVSMLLFFKKDPTTYGSIVSLNYLYNPHATVLNYVITISAPLIACVCNSDINEAEGGLKEQLIVRTGLKRYYVSKHITVFIAGMLNTLYVLELLYIFQMIAIDTSTSFYIGSGAYINYLYADIDRVLFQQYLLKYPILFSHCLFTVISVFAGVCACLSYTISQIITVTGIAYLSGFLVPFFISTILTFISYKAQMFAYYNLFQIVTDTSRTSEIMNVIGIVVWIIVIVTIAFVLQIYKINKNES